MIENLKENWKQVSVSVSRADEDGGFAYSCDMIRSPYGTLYPLDRIPDEAYKSKIRSV